MSGKKLIVVFGATGHQGGSVVKALEASGEFTIRGITRNVEKAKEKNPNIEWVQANQTKPEELKKAFEGAYGAFVVTNFWDQESMGKEVEIGTNLAKIAKEANVQHYIWSTLPNAEEVSGGTISVPHFTDKAIVFIYLFIYLFFRTLDLFLIFIQIKKKKVNDVVKSLNFPFYTLFQAGFYWQNFSLFGIAVKNDDGYALRLPCKATTKIAGCDIEDCGEIILQIFKNPEIYQGKIISLCGEELSAEEMRETFEKKTGKKTILDLSQHVGYPGADELVYFYLFLLLFFFIFFKIIILILFIDNFLF